jgi:hypothetical protein
MEVEVTALHRILLVVAILLVLWRLLSARGRRLDRDAPGADSYSRFSPRKRRQRRDWASSAGGDGPERLVACATCGTYVPARRALTSQTGRRFCSPACRESSDAISGNGD